MARVEFTERDWDRFATMGVGTDDTEDRRDALALYEQMAQARRGREVNAILDAANELLQYHGVDGLFIRDGQIVTDPWDSLHGAEYLNAGDTYAETLLYDAREHAFYLTTYGDWIEAVEGELETAFRAEQEEEEETEPEPPPLHLWYPNAPHAAHTPLIAMLRSVEGMPIAVHLWGHSRENPYLAFSVPLAPGMFTRSWLSIIDAFKRGQNDLYVHERWRRRIERDQFQRLAVAMDSFFERGMEHQAKEFLTVPPVLWTCDELNVDWYEERGEATVRVFTGQDTEHVRSGGDPLEIWSTRSPDLESLIDDGFIQWKNDRSVREYLARDRRLPREVSYGAGSLSSVPDPNTCTRRFRFSWVESELRRPKRALRCASR